MSRPARWEAAAGAVLVVVLLSVCLPALADASAPPAHSLCTAAKGEPLSAASTASPLDLWAVPVDHARPVPALPLSGGVAAAPIPARFTEDLEGSLSSRAPPVRL